MTPEEQAESIRRRMAELRRELTCDMRDVSRSARAMTSPSFYIRKFPWATLAVAAAVGYMLVPKKKQVISPDPEMLAELVRKQQVRLDTSQAAKSSQGMLQEPGRNGPDLGRPGGNELHHGTVDGGRDEQEGRAAAVGAVAGRRTLEYETVMR